MAHLALILATAALLASPDPEAKLPGALNPEIIRALPVQHDGRWPPLDTVARDVVSRITGEVSFEDRDPVLWLLAWSFAPEAWMQYPVITLSSAELRRELQLPPTQTVYSYDELLSHDHLRTLTRELAHRSQGRKMDPLESKVAEINEKLSWLERVFSGNVIKVIPDPEDMFGAWAPIPQAGRGDSESIEVVASAWAELRQAFLDGDGEGFAEASRQMVSRAAALPAAYRPSAGLIATELRYNRLQPFRLAWMVMGVGAVLALAAMFLKRKWFDAIAVAGLLAGFVITTYGLSLRWQIAGRIPAANMFESLLFLGWGMGAFAIIATFALRHRSVPLTASAMGALALFLADYLPLDPFVRPIVPVLRDTVWMSIHVPVIMVSYSVLALAAVLAHVQLVGMAFAPRRRRFANAVDTLHYWHIQVGSILLLAGIITGSMWAASSWGRYWGWDPKEVWSLIAFLGYLAILHVRIDHTRVPSWGYPVAVVLGIALFALVIPKLGPLSVTRIAAFAGTALAMILFVLPRGQFATALKSVACFWLIIMTYLGVNYVLGIGLHSYGFGTGRMTRYMFLIGGIDLLVVGFLSLAYVIRSTPAPSAVAAHDSA